MINEFTLAMIADSLRATAAVIDGFRANPAGFRRDAALGQVMHATAKACSDTSRLCAQSLTADQIVTLAVEAIAKDNAAAAEVVK